MRKVLLATLASLALSLAGSARGLGLERLPIQPDAPIFVAAPEGDPRLFVVERGGKIRIFEGGVLLDPPFLDISGRVDVDDEGGLLSVAFPADYDATRAFYVYYTAFGNAPTEPQSRISRFRASAGNPDIADPAEKILLTLEQPDDNHNGGTIAFDLDGMLFMGFGDGGGRFDPLEAAQDPGTLLGKMIRIDVSFTNFNDGYSVPPDNPYVGPGEPLDEIWDLGLRNPFRFSFDRETGALYIGDVGQDNEEEVDVEPRPDTKDNRGGRNYGWDVMEGTECFDEADDPDELNCNAPELILPVHEYAHSGGRCSITGGVVYRGAARPDLDGRYLFADYCSAEIWSLVWNGGGGVVGPVVELTDELEPDSGVVDNPIAFGEDGAGEVYLVDQDGDIFRFVSVPEPGAPLLLAVGAAALLAAQRTQSRGTRKRSASSASGAPGSGSKA
jgi:glucose/arabinose dehydrogenase